MNNWATEATLKDLVDVLKKSGVGGSKSSGPEKANFKRLAQDVKAFSGSAVETNKTLEKFNKNATSFDDKLKDTTKTTDKINETFKQADTTLEKFGGSLDDATAELLKLVGVGGLFGAVLVRGAKTIQNVINSYMTALQSGFTFGDQMSLIRTELGNVGVGMDAMAELAANAGYSIRLLGETSHESMFEFAALTHEVRDASRHMGFFGLTAVETMEELSTQMDIYRRMGLTGPQLARETRDAFMQLNQETLGLARLTGRSRRDLLRETAFGQDDISRSLLGSMTTEQMEDMRFFEVAFNAMGDTGEAFQNFAQMFAVETTGLAHLMDQEVYRFNSMFGNIVRAQQNMIDVINDSDSTMEDRAQAIANFLAALGDDEDRLAQVIQQYQGTDLARIAGVYLNLLQEGRGLGEDADDIVAAIRQTMTESEQVLLSLNDAVARVQTSITAAIFEAAGLDELGSEDGRINVEELDRQVERFIEQIHSFADTMRSARDLILEIIGRVDDVNVSIMNFLNRFDGIDIDTEDPVNRIIAGLIALFGVAFGTQAFITGITAGLTTALGIAALSLANGFLGVFAIGSPVMTTLMSAVRAFAGPLGALAVSFAAVHEFIEGWNDEELRQLGYSGPEAGMVNLTESSLGLVDRATGFFGFDTQLAESFAEGARTEEGQAGLQMFYNNLPIVSGILRALPRNTGAPPTEEPAQFPLWDPSTNRVSTSHMVMPGVTGTQGGTIQVSPSQENAWRYSQESLDRMAAALEEQNRLARRTLEAIENQ